MQKKHSKRSRKEVSNWIDQKASRSCFLLFEYEIPLQNKNPKHLSVDPVQKILLAHNMSHAQRFLLALIYPTGKFG